MPVVRKPIPSTIRHNLFSSPGTPWTITHGLAVSKVVHRLQARGLHGQSSEPEFLGQFPTIEPAALERLGESLAIWPAVREGLRLRTIFLHGSN